MLCENFIPWLNSILHLNRSLEGLEICFESEMKHEKKIISRNKHVPNWSIAQQRKIKVAEKKASG